MKLKIKGFKSLIKAAQNRAHLFPVKAYLGSAEKLASF